MQNELNREAYKVDGDRLIADIKPDVIADAVTVTVPEKGKAGVIARGTVIDSSENGYAVHSEGGTVSRIVAEDTPYGEADSDVVCATYLAGPFTLDALITDVELTQEDVELFRKNGILLK